MNATIPNLQDQVRQARVDLLTMIYHAGSGHPGGSLSAVDLIAWLYARVMRHDPQNPQDPERDRFILSKGHACPALYAIAAAHGYIPLSEMASFRKLNGLLQGHTHVGATPWAETSTGSLGQGFSTAIGIALGLRHQEIEARTYVMLGDGELQEGEVWEGAMFSAHHRLDRLCAIIDYNKMQSDDLNANIMGLEPLADKWRAFGWHVIEINGHEFPEMEEAFDGALATKGKPTVIMAHTIKGKGVSYMEGQPTWHGSVKLTDDNLKDALSDLGYSESQIRACMDGSIWRPS